ncbi:4-demethylwyosine synthase TYW1 [Candidatus Woesearchaeota archaeon]|jgi:tRNA wybutosine-synthesizing protein 1|nr:4-demethylwyosine synthase TYW1 [Candidatus Woesearchaeota archaeon]MBT4114041.1 4-demethylwyosine synthase TYW1 [Candidatus Woesearchaeota archaeon]MBT4248102.1 4-demethylwyosine synthase TYW1 [Candidatus Woesearchaeota archaeon]
MAKLTAALKKKLEHMHYEIVGDHTALEICSWCKKSLLGEGVCYKEKFYGIKSHRCCQMSPAAGFCDQKCIFCWRPQECNIGTRMDAKVNSPSEIIDGCIKSQIRKLSGFGGNEKADEHKFKQAQEPMNFALSLTGEPTLYPKLGELIAELTNRGKSSFLVTNGQHPKVLERLSKDGNLPTQLYISLDATTPAEFKKINVPLNKDGWQRLNQTLKLMPKLDCRKVIRITVIKDYNDLAIAGFAKLLKIAQPHYVEVKSYMHMGYSRNRLPKEAMPRHSEIRDFSNKLAKELNWKVIDEQVRSRVVLIGPEDRKDRIMKLD